MSPNPEATISRQVLLEYILDHLLEILKTPTGRIVLEPVIAEIRALRPDAKLDCAGNSR